MLTNINGGNPPMVSLTDRQKQIIDVSVEIIAEMGIQQLTIKNISNRLGISEPAIYRHFENKMDILLAILANFKKAAGDSMHPLQDVKGSAVQKMKMLFESHFETFTASPALAAVIFSEEIFQNDKRLSEGVFEIMNMHMKKMSDLVREGQQSGEIRKDIPDRQLSLIITGSLRLIVTKWRLSDFSFDLQAEGLLLWNSIHKLIINSFKVYP